MTGDIIVNIEKLILNLKEMQQIKNSQDNLEKKNERSYIGVIYIWRSYITWYQEKKNKNGGIMPHDIKMNTKVK